MKKTSMKPPAILRLAEFASSMQTNFLMCFKTKGAYTYMIKERIASILAVSLLVMTLGGCSGTKKENENRDDSSSVLTERNENNKVDKESSPTNPEEKPTYIPTLKTGDEISFGEYGGEAIIWQVIDTKESGEALLISKYTIEAKVFNERENYKEVWEKSDIRTWLNDDFYSEAFNSEAQKLISKTEIQNNANPQYGTAAGMDTEDKVFLLSVEEAENYFSSNSDRKCWPAGYVSDAITDDSDGSTAWYLRTPGQEEGLVATVGSTGEIYLDGTGASFNRRTHSQKKLPDGFLGIRPALWFIEKSSEQTGTDEKPLWSIVKSEGDHGSELDINIGDEIYMGEYANEQISWIVLDVSASGEALVISKYALDSKPYHSDIAMITWEESTLRKWLNEDFYNEAFDSKEQKRILTTTVKTPNHPDYGTWGGNDTEDKMFLLSLDEVQKYFGSDKERRCEPTDFAISKNIRIVESDMVVGKVDWWLRSPGNEALGGGIKCTTQTRVMYDGKIDRIGQGTVEKGIGVRPAMWIKMK